MNHWTLVFLLLLSLNSLGFAPNYDKRPEVNVVLGLDKTAPRFEIPFRFPCTQMFDRVYCENTAVRIENKACANTLHVDRLADRIELSCLLRLQKTIIARTNLKSRIGTDKSDFDYFPLEFSNGVNLIRSNQNPSEILIHVK